MTANRNETGERTFEPQRSIFDQLEELKLPPLGRRLTQPDIDDAVADEMAEQNARARQREQR